MSIEVYLSEGGGFVAACRALGCFGSGVTEKMARNALAVALKTKFPWMP